MLSKRVYSNKTETGRMRLANFHLKKSQSGSHILEFSLVLFLLFFIVAGAFDINSALQSYTSLQEGVSKALRCSFPTDGDCVQPVADSRDRLFHVTSYDSPVKQTLINQYDYRATASWYQRTIFTEAPQVIIADTVSYRINNSTSSGSPNEVAPHWVQTDFLPFVSGAGLDPNFNGYPKEVDVTYFHQTEDDLKNKDGTFKVSGTTTSDENQSIGRSKPFTINNPFNSVPGADPNAPCFSEDEENKVDFESSCENEKNMANILFHVKGTVLGTGSGAVMIKLMDGDKELRTLGGRRINGGDYAHDDFTSRGLSKECQGKGCDFQADEDFVNQYSKEAKNHKNVKAPYDTKLHLKFEIVSNDGSEIGWRADEIKIFTSKYVYNEGNVQNTNNKNSTEPSVTIKCPDNYGSLDIAKDCLSLCPVSDANMIPGSAYCTTVTIPKDSFDFIPTCTKPKFIKDDRSYWPVPLRDYAVVGFTETSRTEVVYTKETDPVELLKQEGNLCPVFPIITKVIDQKDADGANVKLNTGSYFAGAWPDLGCNWSEILKHSARNKLPEGEKIHPDAFIETDRKVMGEVEIGGKPEDACTEFREIIKKTGPGTDLGNLAYKDIPKYCLNGEKYCDLDFQGFTPGTEGYASLNTQHAISAYGIPEIQSSFPRANFSGNCDSGYCAEFREIPSGSNDTITYSASMRVPLTTLKIFGMDGIDVSYTDSHRLERIHSK